MIYEKVKRIIGNRQPRKQAIVTISAAVDVDTDSHISIDKQALEAVIQADTDVVSLDGLELEEIVEIREID